MYSVLFMNKKHIANSIDRYDTFEEAENRLNEFANDTSNLYSNISIMDETQTIKEIMLFDKAGKMIDRIYDGDIAKIKPEYLDSPEEAKYMYVIYNINEEFERCVIGCLNSNLSLGSSQLIDIRMLDVIKHNS